jgi:hypothetical protein
MTPLAAMADDVSTNKPRDPGAPVGRDEIDPELVNLRKGGPKFGVVTCAGVAILCLYLVYRLMPDLGYAREPDAPAKLRMTAELADNTFVELPLTIERARAIRLRQQAGGLGMRAVPVAGSGDAVWVLMTGDGWAPAAPNAAYAGRVRELDDLPLADALRGQVRAHPWPAFATLASARAAFAGGPLTTVAGDPVAVAPGDRVELDVAVPGTAVVVITYSKRLPGLAAWVEAVKAAGVPLVGEPRDVTDDTARLDVAIGADEANQKLTAAGLYARVEPVNTTLATTWGELSKTAAGAGSIAIAGTSIDPARVDLVRVFVAHRIPASARVIVVGELPADYWYVLPLVIGLGVLALLALWALVRAIKRDLLTPPAAPAPT